jgi:hypothetical protein
VREAVCAIVRHDARPRCEFVFQPPGPGHKPRAVFALAGAEAAVRDAIEAKVGAVTVWRVRRLTRGREDIPTTGKSVIYPGAGESFDVPGLIWAGPTLESMDHTYHPPDG